MHSGSLLRQYRFSIIRRACKEPWKQRGALSNIPPAMSLPGGRFASIGDVPGGQLHLDTVAKARAVRPARRNADVEARKKRA